VHCLNLVKHFKRPKEDYKLLAILRYLGFISVGRISSSPSFETAVVQWLRYCAINQKVAGSIPDGVVEFFVDISPSDRTMTMGSTQPLTEMGTRSISWG
jgi:hypothetical protein